MIVTCVQGVHHVLRRDKDLVSPIKAYRQSSQKKKKKGNMGSKISKFLSPTLTKDFTTLAEI